MGKVPTRVKFDEDGLPIPQSSQVEEVKFDEDGLPIPVKKKSDLDLSMVGAKATPVGGEVGSSAPQSEREKIANYVKTLGGGVKVQSTTPQTPIKPVSGKAITQVKTTKKPETTFDQTVEEAVTGGIKKINEIMYDTNDDWEDPVKVTLEKSADRTKGNKENLDYLAANVLTRDAILKSGYNASKMLETTPIWAMAKPGENMTADLLKQKKAEFDTKVEPFKAIQLDQKDDGSGVGNDEFYKYVYGDRIYDAAIKAHALKNPNFKDQLLAAGATFQDFENNDLSKFIPQGKLGQIVSETIYDPDVIEYIKNEQPYLLPAVKSVANSLIEDDKTFGANVVANKVSREYLKRKPVTGLSMVANFATQGMKDELNQVAKDVLTDQEYRIYQQKILGNEENYIDTPSMLEGIARGGKQIFSGIKSTFTTPFKSTEEVINKQWEQEASNVSADPKGFLKFLTDSGHTLGIVAGIGATGNVLGGGGVGFYSSKVVPALSGAVPFLGDMLQEGTAKYPNSPVKAWTSAIFNTALYSALSYQIFPAKQIEKVFKGVKPEVSKVVENLANGSITKEVARREMNTIAMQALDLLSGAGVKSAKISAELTGITALNQMLDKVMGMDDKTYEKYHPEGELPETFSSLFLSNLFVGGLAKFGEMKNGNRIVESSLYEAATNPVKYRREIDLLKTKDESIDQKNLLENLDYLVNVKKELVAMGVKPENQGRYLFESLKEKVFSDAIKSTPDANLTRRYKEQIARGEEVKDRILRGEDVVKDENFEIQKENSGLTDSQIAIQKALDNKEITGVYIDIAKEAMKTPESADELISNIKSQSEGGVASEHGNAKELQISTFGKELVDFSLEYKPKGEPEKISQPIEPSREQQLKDIQDGDVVSFEYKSESEVPDIFKDKISSVSEVNGVRTVKVTMAKSLAEYYLKSEQVKTAENAVPIRSTEEVSLGETPGDSGKVGEGISQPKEPTAVQEGEKGKVEGEEVVLPPPPTTPPTKPIEGEAKTEKGGSPKAILNRINESKNISDSVKEKFKGNLTYQPQSHDEARKMAKEILKEFGEDEAVSLAEAGRFDGGVNSMVFAESIDKVFKQEQEAKTQEEKIAFAEKWADYVDRYDKFARKAGQSISAVYDFYKKSPLGVMLNERKKRDTAFKDWYEKREKPFKEVFEEIKNDPEFKTFFESQVRTATKQERAVFRQKRRKKITEAFDKAKIKTNQVNSAIIPPQVWNAAVEVMKQATLAGEHVVDVIEKGVEYIKKNHNDAWDEKAFREDWKERLSGLDSEKKGVDIPERYLEKMRKKLSGMTEKQKEDVIRKSFKKLVENGALEYDDFKKIVADTIGLGELSAEDVSRIQAYIKDMNDVSDLQQRVISENTKEALDAYKKGLQKAEKSATELANMVYTQVNIGKTLRSIAQLSTMGVVSLIKNPFYNIFHQALVRMPKAVLLTAKDQTVFWSTLMANKLFGTKIIRPDYNIVAAQRGYWSGFGAGAKTSVKQLFTGLTNKDYFQKEVYNSQLKPFQSWRDIWDFAKGDKYLTGKQVVDKLIKGTVGIPAEAVARMLNIGDKPFRFAAENAIAETIATMDFGLTGIDRKIFLAMPKEKAKEIYLKKGYSEEEAAKKAENVEKRILREGEEAVFQQDNIVSKKIEALKKLGNETEDKHPMSGIGMEAGRWFGLLNMPFVKTPANIAWEVFNLVNPEFALVQSFAYGAKAYKTKSHADYVQAKKWMAHAAAGLALLSASGYLASIGAVTGDDEDQPYNPKEAKGKATYAKPHTLNISKLYRAVIGGSLKNEDNDVTIDLSWFGAPGMIMNMQANKYENMTKEEREKMGYTEDLMYRMKSGARDGLVNSVFSGTLTAVDAFRTGKADQWILGMMNVGMNILEPATIAQLSRASRKNEYRVKGDDFSETLKNNIKSRFFGNPPKKYNIWGDPVKKDTSFWGIMWNMFGIASYDKDAIGEPMYQDFKRTGNYNFFPSEPQPELEIDGVKKKLPIEQLDQFQALVGQARKNLTQAFIEGKAKVGDKYYSDFPLNEEGDKRKLEILQDLYKKGYEFGKEQFLLLHDEYNKKKDEIDYEEMIRKDMYKIDLEQYINERSNQ